MMSNEGLKGGSMLSSLAGYAMSDSDDDSAETHALSGTISGSDDDHSSHSQPIRSYSPVIKDYPSAERKKPMASSLTLVSYGPQDEDDSDQDGKHSDDDGDEDIKGAEAAGNGGSVVDYEKTFTADDLSAAAGHDSGAEAAVADEYDVKIPPSPPGSPPQSLVDYITETCRRGPGSLDKAIQNNKFFRNPSIYEKLLSHIGLNEKGTNYPPELYDPSIWDKHSHYDELAKLQNIEMEKRKSEKKTKIDFITATKSAGPASTDSGDGSGNKKSKWDHGGGGAGGGQGSSAAPPAVGSLIKRK